MTISNTEVAIIGGGAAEIAAGRRLTEARATAFAFCTSVGRFIGAGVNFALAGAVAAMGTLGTPIALTSIAFGVGLLIIPFARETRGEPLPD